MTKITITGIDENGIIKTEVKSTAVLITELIEKIHGMCEADIVRNLKEIRESAELDATIRKTYANVLKIKKEKSNERKRIGRAGDKGKSVRDEAGKDPEH